MMFVLTFRDMHIRFFSGRIYFRTIYFAYMDTVQVALSTGICQCVGLCENRIVPGRRYIMSI